MNCGEFQKALPYIIDGGGTAEQEAHLKTCAVCSDLVQDLRYIAEQAKLLVPMHDPNPRVWAGIQNSLEKEGLVRPSTAGRFRPTVIPAGGARSANWMRWGGVAAIVVIALALVLFRNSSTQTPATTGETASATTADASLDANDQKLLAVVAKQTPERAEVFKTSLHDVNKYIADAKKASDQDPSDDLAREHLMQAYGQKEMLYDMATSDTSDTDSGNAGPTQ